jgi:PAS domain-containing protein
VAEGVRGWTRGAALGRHLSEVVITTIDGPNEIFEMLDRAMTDGVVITEDRCLRTRDGRMIPLDLQPCAHPRRPWLAIGCVVTFRDNTTRLEAEKSPSSLG